MASTPASNDRVPTHYEVLDVAPDAGHDEIRRAYLRAARRWHPDRMAGGSAASTDDAEAKIRQVNEAWSVLGEADSRRDYDRDLADRRRVRSGAKVGDDGVIRIDPRLLDPEFLAARRHAQSDDISNRSSAVLRVTPMLVLVGLLVGIFVFTAYARGSANTAPPTTVAGPNLGEGIEAGDCVTVLSGPSLLARPCDSGADGQIIGARLPDGVCPVGTVRDVELTNGVIACLGAVR